MGLVTKNPILLHVNNRGADQPTHPPSPISIFIIHFMDSTFHMQILHILASLYRWASLLKRDLVANLEDWYQASR